MNYNHIFHAGNFADVIKHLVISLILQKMIIKSSPFFILDTHAGQGIYDLTSNETRKTNEAESGIFKLLSCLPEILATTPYIRLIKAINPEQVRFYPGSPKLFQSFLRDDDQLTLCELNPSTYATLCTLLKSDGRIKILHQDGYTALSSLLPPLQKRGIILIDSSFEQKDEENLIIRGLAAALKRFAHGIYVIWYPIKSLARINEFYKKIFDFGFNKYIRVDFNRVRDQELLSYQKLQACGLLIINPPWRLLEEIKLIVTSLSSILIPNGLGNFSIDACN